MEASISGNTKEFRAELARYLPIARKEVTEVINTKAFFIALRCLKETPAVKPADIKRELEETVAVGVKRTKSGKFRRGKAIKRIFLIVNARRRFNGEDGLSGTAMEDEARKITGARMFSRSFLKSGWLPALRDLAKKVKAAVNYSGGKLGAEIVGQDKGAAEPAKESFSPVAMIANTADIHGKDKAKVAAVEQGALDRAIAAETASMAEYVRKKMEKSARAASGA